MTQLLEIIIGEIRKRGAVSFEEFMRLALYCPVYGYYEKEEDTIGRNGDFYTSVSVGNLFGELLALQFAQWLVQCQSGTHPVQIVEAGAHRGHLARDILTWFQQNCSELSRSLQYIIVEPSPIRQKWQAGTVGEFGQQVRWISRITDHAPRITGVIFANELLDAMPVRRFGWDAQKERWFEWGITLKNDELAWARLELQATAGSAGLMQDAFAAFSDQPSSRLLQAFKDLALFPDGYTFEVGSEAETWWLEASTALGHGKLMAIDYGMTIEELISPARKDGTLRGYYRHQSTTDILSNPGEQDLTAHVNFSAVIAAGEARGLKTETFETQGQFLTRIAAHAWNGQSFQMNSSRARQFQTLTHPEHLGNSFRVLVQSRE